MPGLLFGLGYIVLSAICLIMAAVFGGVFKGEANVLEWVGLWTFFCVDWWFGYKVPIVVVLSMLSGGGAELVIHLNKRRKSKKQDPLV